MSTGQDEPGAAGPADVPVAVAVTVMTTTRHLDLLEKFLQDHGDAAFDDAMATGVLWDGMRANSRFSLRAALMGFNEGVPGFLLLGLRPAKGKKGEKVEARYMQGSGRQLTIDLTTMGPARADD